MRKVSEDDERSNLLAAHIILEQTNPLLNPFFTLTLYFCIFGSGKAKKKRKKPMHNTFACGDVKRETRMIHLVSCQHWSERESIQCTISVHAIPGIYMKKHTDKYWIQTESMSGQAR